MEYYKKKSPDSVILSAYTAILRTTTTKKT